MRERGLSSSFYFGENGNHGRCILNAFMHAAKTIALTYVRLSQECWENCQPVKNFVVVLGQVLGLAMVVCGN